MAHALLSRTTRDPTCARLSPFAARRLRATVRLCRSPSQCDAGVSNAGPSRLQGSRNAFRGYETDASSPASQHRARDPGRHANACEPVPPLSPVATSFFPSRKALELRIQENGPRTRARTETMPSWSASSWTPYGSIPPWPWSGNEGMARKLSRTISATVLDATGGQSVLNAMSLSLPPKSFARRQREPC